MLIKFLLEIHLRTTGCRLPYGITQCYLPPGTNERTRHMFAAIIKSVYFIVPSDAGMFELEGELHRLHHKPSETPHLGPFWCISDGFPPGFDAGAPLVSRRYAEESAALRQ